MRVLVIIPALNEKASIGRVIAGIREALPDADVLVIDDGSTDGTAALARASGAVAVSLPYNMGVGAALRTGFRYAARHRYDVVVQCDADGQHPAEHIPLLLDSLDQGSDMVIGSRFAVGDGHYHVESTRGAAMWIIRATLRVLTRRRFTDPTSGFRAFSRPVVEEFANSYPREFLSDTVEALLIACYAGYRVTEAPVSMLHRQDGTPSHTSLKLMYQYLHLLIVIALTVSRRGRSRRPHQEAQ